MTPPPQIPAAEPVVVPEVRIERLLRGSDHDCALVRSWLSMNFLDRRGMMTDVLIETRDVAAMAVRQLEIVTRPGSNEDIAQLLLAFVEMLNVMEPGERGIRLYEAALGILPLALYPKAAMIVARTHRWRSLPTPADFIGAVAGELRFIDSQRGLLTSIVDGVTTTLNQRDHQRRTTGA